MEFYIQEKAMRKIAVWGTGKSSEDFISTVSSNVKIVAYIDNFPNEEFWKTKPIYKLETFLQMNIEYEYLIVASTYSNEIFDQCYKIIDMNKVIFLYPLGASKQANSTTFSQKSIDFLQEIAPDYAEKWQKRQVLENESNVPDSTVYQSWKGNRGLKDKHYGQRCFILGNGPSLNEVDLSKLENEIVFTTNFFNKVDGYKKAHTNYHFWIDGAFFDQREDVKCDMNDAINCYQQMAKEAPVCFVPFFAADFIKEHRLDDILDIHYLRIKKPLDEYCKEGFKQEELDIAFEIPAWRNVVQYAIEVAIYMGFKEIYLLGCNATCVMPVLDYILEQDISPMHVYQDDTVQKMAKGLSQNWSMSELFYDQYLVFWGYEKLYQYCSERNIQLINCTSKTLINKIPRMDIKKVIN